MKIWGRVVKQSGYMVDLQSKGPKFKSHLLTKLWFHCQQNSTKIFVFRVFIRHWRSENSLFTMQNSLANIPQPKAIFLFRYGASFKIFSCKVAHFSATKIFNENPVFWATIWVSTMMTGLLKQPLSICQSRWNEIGNAFSVIHWVLWGPRTMISALLRRRY